jgi:hypothetical protein
MHGRSAELMLIFYKKKTLVMHKATRVVGFCSRIQVVCWRNWRNYEPAPLACPSGVRVFPHNWQHCHTKRAWQNGASAGKGDRWTGLLWSSSVCLGLWGRFNSAASLPVPILFLVSNLVDWFMCHHPFPSPKQPLYNCTKLMADHLYIFHDIFWYFFHDYLHIRGYIALYMKKTWHQL